MAPTRDTSVYKESVTVDVKATGSAEDELPKKRTWRDHCSAIKCCLSVGPWVPLVAVLMVAVGLPFWVVYLRRALNYSTMLFDEVLGQRASVIDHMSDVVDWVVLIGVIAISSLMGLCLLLSFLRTFQQAARLPTTRCSPPRKLSYGTYITLISVINFGMWLLAIATAAMLACTFVWLIMALATENLFKPPATSSALTPAAYFNAAEATLNGLASTYPAMTASVPKPSQTNFRRFDNAVNAVVAADRQDPLRMCPSSCLSIGSLATLLKVEGSCYCDTASFPHYQDRARDVWKSLLYVMGGLALQGVAALWLLMNLSANYAHTRRDMRETPGKADPWDMDPNASAYTAPIPAYVSRENYVRTQKKTAPAAIRQQSQDTLRTTDTVPKTLPPIRNNIVVPPALRPAAMTEAAIVPPPPELAQAPSITREAYTFNYPAADTSAPEVQLQDTPGRGDTPSPRDTNTIPTNMSDMQPLEPNPSASATNTIGRAYNSTAQRYAAYRLRTATAKSSPGSKEEAEGRRKWVR